MQLYIGSASKELKRKLKGSKQKIKYSRFRRDVKPHVLDFSTTGTLRLATTDYRRLDGRFLKLGRDKGFSPEPPSWDHFVALGRYVVEQIHVVESRLQRRQRVRIKVRKNGVVFQTVDLYYFYLKKCSFKRFCLCSETCFVDRFSRVEKII